MSAPSGTIEYRYAQYCTTGTAGTHPFFLEVRQTRPTLVINAGGAMEYYAYDTRGNVTIHSRFPTGAPAPTLTDGSLWVPSDPDLRRCCVALGTPNIPAGSLTVRRTYLADYPGGFTASGCGAGPADRRLCNKPLSEIDANGNQTDFTYDQAHGGILTVTGPAVNGIRPQTRSAYVQRQAMIRNASNAIVATGVPIWLLSQTSTCRTGAASGNGCAIAGDEVITTYDYGPATGANNLLLRGVVVDAGGLNLRTCYRYDTLGNRISETRPEGTTALTACP
jgi:hypothetical protein